MAIGRRDDVTIRYGADDTRFQKVTKRVKQTGAEVSGFFGKVGSSISAVFGRSLPGAIAATATAFTVMSKSALQSADAIAKTSDKIGVNIEDLQKLRYTAEANGVSQAQFDTSLQRFARRLGEAANGTGVLKKELDELGIATHNAQGNARETIDVLRDYANAIQGAESAQEQLRLTVAAMDTEGAGNVVWLREGAKGMAVYAERAEELGRVLGEKTVREAEALNQAWDDMTTRWGAYWKETILDMTLAMDGLAGNYRTAATAVERLVEIEEELQAIEDSSVDTSSRLYDTQNRRIEQLQRERKELKEKAAVLKEVEQNEKDAADAAREAAAAAAAAAKKAAAAAAAAAAKAKGPENTYHQQNLADYGAYKSGEITRDEWLERERERNPFSNPNSPYAAEMGFKDGAAPSMGSVNPTFTVNPVIDPSFVEEMKKAARAALEGETYKVKVLPEIVGYSGDAIEQAATQEGETNP